ncbi:MAG: hypothetical protein A2X90_00100 [Deltaproteobacteria bacterium GWA2_65_63]|nr:MAG: hypothetical protein A2X90_00100 [Deltaproteobacteria bacterium GWA2_65_63]
MAVKVNVPHIHPLFVHFPQALFPVAFAAFSLYLLTGIPEFETGAFVAALFGALAAPVTTATGFFDWWNRYQAYLTSVFKIKITGSFVLMALAGPAVLLRAFHPGLAALPLGGLGWAYFGLLAACTATCVVLGYYGGKLVFH